MKKISIFAIITFIIVTSISYVVNANDNEKIEEVPTKSEEYKKWESLTSEEKENSIMPNYFDILIDSSVKKSTLNNLLKSDISTLPSSYNLRTTLSNLSVKDQKGTGSCWAFAFSSMMETTMANKYKKNDIEYSPMHIDYKTTQIFNRKVGEGGSPYIPVAYAISGHGPIYEQDFPFDSVYDEEKNNKESYYLSDINDVDLNKDVRESVKDVTYFANIYKSYAEDSITYKDSIAFWGYTKYTDEEVNAMRKLIKQHIKEDGAVTATFYADSMAGLAQNGDYRSIYFNNEKNAYYYTGILSANHAVTIVGWDDNFKKENFSSKAKQPIHDGAYIVLNSWGTGFADSGYFYVSYDDAIIEQQICGINKIEDVEKNKNIILYEYDPLGANYFFYAINEAKTEYLDLAYAANVYSRDSSKSEILSEIGVYLFTTEGVEVYINPNDDNKNNCTKVASYIGSNALEPGYHTIKLNSPITLTGNKFVVKVKYLNSNKTAIPIECNFDESGLANNSIYSIAKSNIGESFISMDGENWTDLYDYEVDSNTLKNTNACIKATTVLSDEAPSVIPVTGITLDKTTATVKTNETVKLTKHINPDDATNKNVTWSSSDESVATVENGIVTGKKEGQARITVTTEDGDYTANCIITVQREAPEITEVSVAGINLDKTTATIKVNETVKLTEHINPDDATNKNVAWSSSDESVATVENGIVTGKKEGQARITVTTEDGDYTANCIITVQREAPEITEISVTGISLNKKNVNIKITDTTNLVATITPENATNKKVRWTSNNEKVAKVENGVVTGIGEGEAIITVTTEDGNYKDTAKIIVTKYIKSDDDTYKEKSDTEKDIIKTTNTDNTQSPRILPNTGKGVVIVIITTLLGALIFSYIKIRKMKDVK